MLQHRQVPVPDNSSIPNISQHLGLTERSCSSVPRPAALLRSPCQDQLRGASSPSRRARRHGSPSVLPSSHSTLSSALITVRLAAGSSSKRLQISRAEALHAPASKQSAGVPVSCSTSTPGPRSTAGRCSPISKGAGARLRHRRCVRSQVSHGSRPRSISRTPQVCQGPQATCVTRTLGSPRSTAGRFSSHRERRSCCARP